jgi:hypothetical protein
MGMSMSSCTLFYLGELKFLPSGCGLDLSRVDMDGESDWWYGTHAAKLDE